jgi:DNA polymerase-4
VGYAEVPDFHVAVARLARPDLVARPVLVGGDPEKRGKVLAASGDLQILGIQAGMPLSEALDRARDAVWVRTDMAAAREAEAVETAGLGGFYMAAPAEREEALALAQRLESRVLESTGLPLRTGIAPARFAAFWAAEDAGASGACVIGEQEFEAYLLSQPIERFPGIGPKTAARLAELGASDVSSLRALGLERLEVLLGNHGRSLWTLACGEDPKALRARRHPASLSREETFPEVCGDADELGRSLLRLTDLLETALRREGLGASRIAVRLTFADSHKITRSQTFDSAVSAAGPLAAAAQTLLARTDAAHLPIRKLALVLAGLESAGAEDRQLDLF